MMRDVALVIVLFAGTAALAEARAGLRSGEPRRLSSDTKYSKYEEVFFSEMLYGDEAVVVLEDGPFKFTASCKTVDYDYSYYNSSSSFSPMPSSYYPTMSSDYNSSTTYTYSSSSRYYYSHTSTSGCYNPCSSSSSFHTYSSSPCSTTSTETSTTSEGSAPADAGTYPPTSTFEAPSTGHSSGCDSTTSESSSIYPTSTFLSDSYYSYSESFAALELTYTAAKADYVYGSPSYSSYPGETVLVGAYEAGESRTQTVFAGRDGGWGDDSTLSSTSGYYATINGDKTIGIHKDWTEYLPGGNSSFPEGVECMISGFITYVKPDN